MYARNWGPKPAGSEANVDSLTADVKNVWSQTAVVVFHFVVCN
jgi:tRNA1(Val) A37 N6-methylase TrmN6